MSAVATEMCRRLETPDSDEQVKTAQPVEPYKYFIVSAGCHANQPKDRGKSHIATEHLKRLPGLEIVNVQTFVITEGSRLRKIKTVTTDCALKVSKKIKQTEQ